MNRGAVQPESPETRRGRTAVVAYEPGEVRNQIVNLVEGMGFATMGASDGDEAIEIVTRQRPDLMVVDAGIEGRPSFELCAFVRKEKIPTRIILVASVYRRTRYKRKPVSLHGADDYVEQHHIHDRLPEKVDAVLGGFPHWDGSRFVDHNLVRRYGDVRMDLAGPSSKDITAAARRLAWIIVTDMALYNPELRSEPRARYSVRSVADVEEGRRVFAELVPSSLGEAEDFLGDALDRLRRGRS